MKTKFTILSAVLSIILAWINTSHAATTFSYQGQLRSADTATTGIYDFQFTLHDAATGSGQIGSTASSTAVPVTNGLFTTSLDFGTAAFDGPRWLQIAVKSNGVAGPFTPLNPRQPVTPAPHALFAQIAASVPAGSLTTTQLADGAVTSSKIANAQVVRSINLLTDAVNILPGEGLTMSTIGNTLQLAAAPPNCNTYSNCYWSLFGNGNVIPNVNFLGSVAGELAPLEFRVNNTHALRFEVSNGTPNFIGGHNGNAVGSNVTGATIGGGGASGAAHLITSDYATISGGRGNTVWEHTTNSTIGGGVDNSVGDIDRFILSESCTIAGGALNHASGQYNTIGGGSNNTTIVHSLWGPASFSTIGGGEQNRISGFDSTIGGGRGNNIRGGAFFTTIGGGDGNEVLSEGNHVTIGGGTSNSVNRAGYAATISGGRGNRIGAFGWGSTIAGGENNSTHSFSSYSIIPGGRDNEAASSAFAAGTAAKAVHNGAFVWGDASGPDIASTNDNSVTMRAGGGYRLFSSVAANAGAYLAPGSGGWIAMSDRNAKENLQPINGRAVLDKVVALPVHTWNYKSQTNGVRHIGTMAQDFHKAFGMGETETGINTVDADGVALAAIQGLNQKLDQQIQAQNSEIRELRAALATAIADLKIVSGAIAELGGKARSEKTR